MAPRLGARARVVGLWQVLLVVQGFVVLICASIVGAAETGALRAAQISIFEGQSTAEMEAELGLLKNAGVNAVIVRVFHNRGDRYHPVSTRDEAEGVYFKTSRAPVVTDLLSDVVYLSRKLDLLVFAWMTTRYADYGIHGRPDLKCVGFDLGLKKEATCRGLDLFNDEAIVHLEALYSDLALYDVDGVLFQDDLMLRHNEGFGPSASRLFFKETGLKLDPNGLYSMADGKVEYTPLFWRWAEWKNRRLMRVAARLRDAARKNNPDALFAVNLMYENVTNPQGALAWLSQSLSGAVETGFDYYSLMAYHRQISDELGAGEDEAREIVRQMALDAARMAGSAGKVIIKVQSMDFNTKAPIPNDEVSAYLGDVVQAGVNVAIMPYRSGLPWEALARSPGAAGGAR